MNKKTHVYFVPGLAANTKIFEHIKLNEALFETHLLDWNIPTATSESIENYAARMCEKITDENVILVGVSFGGIMVQEMSKHINSQKTIIISSIKSNK